LKQRNVVARAVQTARRKHPEREWLAGAEFLGLDLIEKQRFPALDLVCEHAQRDLVRE
jgi:aspartate oxidase